MIWDDAAVADLRRYYEEGKSGGEMGRIFGCTRNAVIGKISRLGLRETKTKAQVFLDQPKQAGKRLRERPRSRSNPGYSDIDDRFMPYLPPDPANPENMKCCTLFQLTAKTCHWPIGDPRDRDFHFCGNDVAGDGSIYCHHHTRIAYVTTAQRRAMSAQNKGQSHDGPQS